MIRCNLAVLLAERGLKMSDIVRETKLAKNTIRSLFYNEAQGIQFHTLETICEFLSVDLDDLLEIVTFNASIQKIEKAEENHYTITISINMGDENYIDEILLTKEPNDTSKRIYPPLSEDEKPELKYLFKISRKLVNTLLTLPEKKRKPYVQKEIVDFIFSQLGIKTEETTYGIQFQSPSESSKYLDWYSYHSI